MKRFWLLAITLICLLPLSASAQRNVRFKDYFNNATLRIDYLRIGCMKHNTCILQRFAIQNDIWAGSTTQLMDPIDNGDYRLLVVDSKSRTELYSRCYNTLFGEYCFTIAGHDKDSVATFEEVMLMPLPKVPVEICLQKRDKNNQFVTTTTYHYNPTDNRLEKLRPRVKPLALHNNGDPHTRIDIVIVAEGYGKQDQRKMREDFDKFTSYLLGEEPFKSRADQFNVWGIGFLANESGVTDPNANRYVSSAVGSTYNIFNMDRYLMTTHLFQLHNLLAGCPYDHILIMANCDTYGGGAIYNYYAFSAVQEMSRFILPHELGHSIGGLADEYVEDDPNYNRRYENIEPTEPNITSLKDFQSKWQYLVPQGTPIPTTAPKGPMTNRDCGPVGAYEGAGYLAKGCYRPCPHCMMRDYAYFCPVCMKRMNEIFDLYTK